MANELTLSIKKRKPLPRFIADHLVSEDCRLCQAPGVIAYVCKAEEPALRPAWYSHVYFLLLEAGVPPAVIKHVIWDARAHRRDWPMPSMDEHFLADFERVFTYVKYYCMQDGQKPGPALIVNFNHPDYDLDENHYPTRQALAQAGLPVDWEPTTKLQHAS